MIVNKNENKIQSNEENIKFINLLNLANNIWLNPHQHRFNIGSTVRDGNSDKSIFDDIFSGIFGYHTHTHAQIFYCWVHLIDDLSNTYAVCAIYLVA